MAAGDKLVWNEGAVSQNFCSEHEGRIADMFCIRDETVICAHCLCEGKGKHVGHVATTLDDWCSRKKKQAIDVEDEGEELAKTMEQIIFDVTKCGQDVEKLHTEYGNVVKKDYERVVKVLENWGNKTVQAMAQDAESLSYPEDLREKQLTIRKLCDSARMLDFPCNLQELASSMKQLKELQKNLQDNMTQVDELKRQKDGTKHAVEDLENTFKTKVKLFNEEVDDCITAINSVVR